MTFIFLGMWTNLSLETSWEKELPLPVDIGDQELRLGGVTHGLEGLGSLGSMFLAFGDLGSPHSIPAP